MAGYPLNPGTNFAAGTHFGCPNSAGTVRRAPLVSGIEPDPEEAAELLAPFLEASEGLDEAAVRSLCRSFRTAQAKPVEKAKAGAGPRKWRRTKPPIQRKRSTPWLIHLVEFKCPIEEGNLYELLGELPGSSTLISFRG